MSGNKQEVIIYKEGMTSAQDRFEKDLKQRQQDGWHVVSITPTKYVFQRVTQLTVIYEKSVAIGQAPTFSAGEIASREGVPIESANNLLPAPENSAQVFPYSVAANQTEKVKPALPEAKKKPGPVVSCLFLIVFVVGACFIGSQVQKAITPTSTLSASVTETIKTDAPNTDQPARPTQKPASAVKTFAHFEDGVYIVGKDITPGTYRTRSGSDSCYYERLSGFGNTIGNIIAIENTDDPAIVTIAATDKGFKSTRCGTWTKDLSRITSSKTTFEDGMYIVGTDIEPGTYKSDGESSCYYERLSNFGNASGAIIAIENTDGPAIVTIAATDKGFKSTRCGTWKRI